MEKCPVCGGSLVWDYREGVIVCGSCGLVVDRIYEYGYKQKYSDEPGTRRNTRVRSIIDKRAYNTRLKLYKRIYKIVREKPWMTIDADRVLETGRFVNTIKSKASILAEENIVENGLKELVEKGLEIIKSENPALLARSFRGRYALAYMVAYAKTTGDIPPEDFIVKTFNISSTSYKRLKSIVRKYWDIGRKLKHNILVSEGFLPTATA
ncbi:TFIIB-type zinc ribbon-containing protein [Thermogladius sp. 4427co]|uniref:TFIIB-type zinc ribbon-containing protein n=1 Tax=Thermogladius sp. 4427co TaxID=3450718 RepID=UPI003F7A6832